MILSSRNRREYYPGLVGTRQYEPIEAIVVQLLQGRQLLNDCPTRGNPHPNTIYTHSVQKPMVMEALSPGWEPCTAVWLK